MTGINRDLAIRYRFAQSIVREAGQIAAEQYRRRDSLNVERKGRQDFVSEADKKCEDFLVSALLGTFPEDGALGEENGLQNGNADAIWVIDPIDGTTNFISGFPLWCVSVGLVAGARPVIGVIYNPITEELYAAMAGDGARLNGSAIRASATASVESARMGIGFSYRRPVEEHLRAVDACLRAGCEYVRFGSGALGMAHTADGRLDGYFEAHINPWDVAAGLVIVSEAGGKSTDYFGHHESMAKGNVILATAPNLMEPMSSLLLSHD